MKNGIRLFLAALTVMLISTATNAQPVDVDNQTSCDYIVKANEGTTACSMGMGPVAVCAATSLTTLSTPPGGVTVTAFGCEKAGSGATPLLVGDPACTFPSVVTLPAAHPNSCGGTPTTFEYRGRLLIIR